MTVLKKFNYSWPDGVTPLEFTEWIATLPQNEQDAFAAGKANQESFKQTAIDEGRLTVAEDGSYVWADQEAYAINKENDATWYAYWQRWQLETGVQFSVEIIEQ